MKEHIRIGLIGEFSHTVVAHQAIELALPLTARALGIRIEPEWIPTDQVRSTSHVAGFDGLWCVPASPYRSMDGALLAIRYARENGVPYLGTCGGFQYALVEYARNVLGWTDADHAETAPDAARAVISPLQCALVETTGAVRLYDGSRIARSYGSGEITEGYHCRYGMNPAFRQSLVAGPLRAAADDETGEVRAVELDDHPFYVATLFQPERAALAGKSPPLVRSFAGACAGSRT